MRKLLLVLIICLTGLLLLSACRNSASPEGASPAAAQQTATSPASNAPSDAMTTELRKLAGANGTDCGRIPTNGNVQPASDCAMRSNEGNKPFFVRYDLPVPDAEMAIATVRTSDGKLMTVQYDSKGLEKPQEGGTLAADSKVSIVPCPEPNTLRLANSGRVTCFPPSQMPAGMSPHAGGVSMPPASGASPHGGMMDVPKNLPSPHKSPEPEPKKPR